MGQNGQGSREHVNCNQGALSINEVKSCQPVLQCDREQRKIKRDQKHQGITDGQ